MNELKFERIYDLSVLVYNDMQLHPAIEGAGMHSRVLMHGFPVHLPSMGGPKGGPESGWPTELLPEAPGQKIPDRAGSLSDIRHELAGSVGVQPVHDGRPVHRLTFDCGEHPIDGSHVSSPLPEYDVGLRQQERSRVRRAGLRGRLIIW